MLDGTEINHPEPNLHVCGEDGTQRVLYKLKEEHAKGRSEHKRKKESIDWGRRTLKEKELYRLPKENDRYASSELSIYVKVNLFIPQKLI